MNLRMYQYDLELSCERFVLFQQLFYSSATFINELHLFMCQSRVELTPAAEKIPGIYFT